MGWISRLFFGKGKPVQSSGGTLTDVKTDFSSASQDIMAGVEFIAELGIWTSLVALQHHGELFRGPRSKAPKYGGRWDGYWLEKTKSWTELSSGRPETEEEIEMQKEAFSRSMQKLLGDEFTHEDGIMDAQSSDIGRVDPSDYIPFLIEFRTIVEGEGTLEEKLDMLNELPGRSGDFTRIWDKLCAVYPDLPVSFFYLPFTLLPGVGPTTAKRFFDAGFRTRKEIVNASVERLTAVPGIGQATAEKIKGTGTIKRKQYQYWGR
jgi:hypothetical protein